MYKISIPKCLYFTTCFNRRLETRLPGYLPDGWLLFRIDLWQFLSKDNAFLCCQRQLCVVYSSWLLTVTSWPWGDCCCRRGGERVSVCLCVRWGRSGTGWSYQSHPIGDRDIWWYLWQSASIVFIPGHILAIFFPGLSFIIFFQFFHWFFVSLNLDLSELSSFCTSSATFVTMQR